MPHEIFIGGNRSKGEKELGKPLPTGMNRRELLQGLAALVAGAPIADVFGKENAERTEEDVRVDIVDEGKEKVPFRLHLFAPEEREKPQQTIEESTLGSIPSGRHKLFVSTPKPNTFLEVSYEVLDRDGNIQWSSGKTHVPQIVDIPEGGSLRIRRFPPISIVPQNEKNTILKSTREPEPAEEKERCSVKITREREKEPHFGILVTCRRKEDGKEFYLSDEGEDRAKVAEGIPPGRYDVLIRPSRSGFPQFGIVRVLDAQGKVVEEYPPTYEPLYNPEITLRKDERLSISILPPVRPYNSVFFTVGEEDRRATTALVIPRPYPSQDFETHRGTEQFNALPMSIAFHGHKIALEHAEEVAKILKDATNLPDSAFIAEHPAWALGCREVARRLAAAYTKVRAETTEDVRGQDHLSLLTRRTAEGKLPKSLHTISEEELAEILFTHLTKMYAHNVHRINEGGGYHNQSFRQDLEEAEQKMQQWPVVCFRATEADMTAYNDAEKPEEKRSAIERALYAIGRELQNYASYPPAWLAEVQELCPEKSIDRRKAKLEELRKTLEEAAKPN